MKFENALICMVFSDLATYYGIAFIFLTFSGFQSQLYRKIDLYSNYRENKLQAFT